MSCICQYYAAALDKPAEMAHLPDSNTDDESVQEVMDIIKAPETDDTKIAVCASELANCRAENWLLKKKLHDCEITIENLEQLVTTIVDKQHQVLEEMFELRKRYEELQTEGRLQRDYHQMERNALIQELRDLQTLPSNRAWSPSSGNDGSNSPYNKLVELNCSSASTSETDAQSDVMEELQEDRDAVGVGYQLGYQEQEEEEEDSDDCDEYEYEADYDSFEETDFSSTGAESPCSTSTNSPVPTAYETGETDSGDDNDEQCGELGNYSTDNESNSI